jgi:hypothetical protein
VLNVQKSRPFYSSRRSSGSLLVEHFGNEGPKTATINKKIAWLNAAVNFGMKEARRGLTPEEAHAEYLDRLTNAWKGNQSTDPAAAVDR